MATSSEVRNKSQEIDDGIRIQTGRCVKAKADFIAALTKLQAYPTQFKDNYLDVVEAYTPDDLTEEAQKIIKDQQVTEFTALRDAVDAVVTVLNGVSEF